MQGNFSPLKAIINPPGVQAGMPGETLELHAVVMNQGNQSAIIDVFLDEAFQLFSPGQIPPRERVALAAGQSTEVSFQVQIPLDLRPGTYDYTLIIDAPQHYPQDTPIPYPRQIKVLIKEQTIVREHDPTFSVQPTSNPDRALISKPHEPLQVTIAVENRSRRVDSFRLTCPDLEPEWYTIHYPTLGVPGMGLLAHGDRVELNPGAVGQIFLTFNPPLDALAGSYILTIRLHSENSPDLVLLDLVYIQIPPVHRLDVGLNTILGQVKRSSGQYEIKLANLGNTPRQLTFSAKTQAEDELCRYQFDSLPVKILPSKSTVVNLTVTPTQWWRRPLLGGGLFINFQIDVEDQQNLPIATPTLQGSLVWQARPWWQFLLLLLFILGLLGGLGIIAWKILHPQSAKLVKLELQNRQIDEGDRGLLNWKIDHASKVDKLLLITEGGPSPQKKEYKIEELTAKDSATEESRCLAENQSLICDNFKTDAKAPGEYTFELKILDRTDHTLDTKKTEKLTIVPKPEPEIISFKPTTPAKIKYAQGEPILVNWTIQYLQKLAAIQITAKSEDASNPYDQTIPEAKLTKSETCTQDRDKQQIICTNFPINITQPGKYDLQIKPISKSEQKSPPDKSSTTAAPPIKIEVLPKPLKIVAFSINGSSDTTKVVQAGETLTVNWQVDGEENMNVEIDPGGTVPRQGSKSIQAIQGLTQISLVATDRYGKKDTRSVRIQVEATAAPTNTQTPTTTPNSPLNPDVVPTPLPSTQKLPTKFPKDFKDW